LASHTVTAAFIPLLWYLIGRRLDFGPGARYVDPSEAERILTVTGLVTCVLATAFMTAVLFTARVTLLGVLVFAWLAAGSVTLVRRMRRWKPDPTLPSALRL
jgi:hypothetical protein